jgi:hypothetical protein
LLSVPLMALLAVNVLGPRAGAVFAVGLFALSDDLIAHASEVKQYSGDAFFACLLLWMATRDAGPPRSTVRRLWPVMVVAAFSLWFSYTVAFVAAGVWVGYVASSRPRGRQWVGFIATGVPVVASAVALYLVCVRYQQHPEFYRQWRDNLADWSKPFRVPVWAAVQTYYLADYAAAPLGAVTLLLGAVGATGYWRNRRIGRPIAVVLLAPIALCLMAALADRYPYGGVRTSAFLMPGICLLAGAGFAMAIAARAPLVRQGARVAAAFAAAFLLFLAVKNLILPRTRSHIRPVVEYVAGHGRPGDRVWVVGGAPSDIYRCYVDPVGPLTRLDLSREALPPLPTGRTWLVFAGSPDRLVKDVIAPRLADARKAGAERDHVAVRGGAAYLFEAGH